MKRLVVAALLAVTSLAFGATTLPPSLISPTGSTAGQAIISTGASTAPVWGAVPLTGITGTLAITNGGTGATTAAAARTNLGLGTAATQNTGTSGATVPLLSTANTWTLAQAFTVRPTFNGATPWDSANLVFATPPAIGGTTPAAGAFTTLSASGLITPSSTVGIKGTAAGDNAQAGSFGEYSTNSTSGTSLTSGTTANATSISLTAGDWDLECTAVFLPAATTVVQVIQAGVNSTSATLGGIGTLNQLAASFTTGTAQTLASPVVRQNLSASGTAYCPVQAAFTTSTMTVNGFVRARRVR